MQYTSPYKLFNCSSLELLQKKVAQFGDVDHRYANVKDSDTVHLFSTKLVKSELRRILNEVEDKRILSHHQAIFSHKSLLNFLEYGHINLFRNKEDLSSYSTAFLTFIYPYFSFQFKEAMEYALKTRDGQTVELLSSFDDSIFSLETTNISSDKSSSETAERNDQLDDYVRQRFENLKGLKNKENLISLSEKELVSYLSNKCIEVYNALPDYYGQLRNDIAKEAITISKILLDDFGRQDGATAILKQGVKLKMDDALKLQMEGMLSAQQVKTKIPTFIIWAAIAVCALYLLQFVETLFTNS